MDGGLPSNDVGSISCLSIVPDPPHLDFGSVVVGSTAARNLAIANHCGGDVVLTLGQLQGADTTLFTVSPAAGSAMTLPDGATRSLSVKYQPIRSSSTQSQAYFALSVCTDGTDCSTQVVLQGLGVASGLAVVPPLLHFGFVPPNQTATNSFTITNGANTTVHLVPSILNANDGGSGPFQPGAGFPTALTALAPGESLVIAIAFGPTSAAFFEGQVDVSTDDVGNALLTLPLDGYGGGPTISCVPNALDFGQNAVGVSATLSTLCTNVGVDVPGHPEANLIFDDPSSDPPGVPFRNQDPSFQPSFDALPPTQGLAAGQSVQIDVRYTPSVAGADSDVLLVASNDAANRLSPIALSGSALSFKDCSYQVNPGSGLAFGHVGSGLSAVLPFEIVNQGTDSCLLKELRLAAGSDPAFSLPDYPVGSSQEPTLAPGSRLAINVQFAPTSAGNFTGVASLLISDQQAPDVAVSLSGSSQGGCLVFQPASIDFGVEGYDSATGKYCESTRQTVTVWNICDTQDVELNNLPVFDLASPNQFKLTRDPSPVTIPKVCPQYFYCPPTSLTTFQISFSPSQSGIDLGGVRISASDLADPYLLPIKGAATPDTQRTDAFTARTPELDLLWVIDTENAGSILAQQAIVGDLSNFLAFPQQNGIDLHIATTSTDVYANANSEDGRMEPCPGCKVDGPAMQVVTLANGLQSAVSALGPLIALGGGVQCSGASCNGFGSTKQLFEATDEALSPALLKGHNQAFYRDEAALAVIVVIGDSEDDFSNAHGWSFYYDDFISLKGIQHPGRFSFSRVTYYGGIGDNQKTSFMAQVTGGVEADRADTGTPNWTDELNGFWDKVGAPLLDYPLSGAPVSSTISVTDNGIPIAATGTGGAVNWTYDGTANALRLSSSAFPPGDSVQVSYTLACGN